MEPGETPEFDELSIVTLARVAIADLQQDG
jgi:hypothetical protein